MTADREREGIRGIIEARDLQKTFGSTSAVDGITFSVQKGEVFGFLGPNGAGKTTTMKMIACVSPKTSGSLTVLGMDPDTDPAAIKARLGVVPQETNLDPDFTCFGNLYTYARYFDIPEKAAAEKADELLGFMQLTEKRDIAIDKLSGGMRGKQSCSECGRRAELGCDLKPAPDACLNHAYASPFIRFGCRGPGGIRRGPNQRPGASANLHR